MVDFNNRQSFVFVLILNKMCFENGILDQTLLLLLSTSKTSMFMSNKYFFDPLPIFSYAFKLTLNNSYNIRPIMCILIVLKYSSVYVKSSNHSYSS